MGRGRTPKRRSTLLQSAEAKRLLRDDTPEAVRLALRLAVRGGRQQRRRCLGCGRRGIHVKVWTPTAVWMVEAQEGAGIRVYWLCGPCDARFTRDGLPAELVRKLQR
jgi:hypothetical protein